MKHPSILKMNPALQLAVRDATCTKCRMSIQADGKDVCVTGIGPNAPRVVIVTKMPVGPKSHQELVGYLTEVGFDLSEVMFLSALKCRTWDMDPNKTDQKACKQFLDSEIEFLHPEWVLAMGNEALFAATGHSGIMKYRGGTFDHSSGAKVFATISAAMVARNPGLRAGFLGDLRYFKAHVDGVAERADHEPTPDEYHVVNTKADLKAFVHALSTADGMSFDIETTYHDWMEFAPDAAIISFAATLWHGEETNRQAWALPLFHPESPWRDVWQRVLALLAKHLRKPKKSIAHNGKFDCRWLKQFDVTLDLTFDTIIAAHLLNENGQKGLKPLAQQLLGAQPWGMNTKDLLNEPLVDVLWYNTMDTWNTARLYPVLRKQLRKNKRLVRLFTRLMMPAQNELVNTERTGIYVDIPKLMTHWQQAKMELQDVESRIMEWVPDEHPFIKYDRHGNVKDNGVNFNASNFLRWWLFEYLQLPVMGRGKTKDNGDLGAPSVAEAIMMELAELHDVPKLLLERGKWFKYCSSFFSAYAEQADANSRIHSTLKLTGTVTGRLSSGKPDAEKITAKRQTRGVNTQQVPRDPFVRGVFGAEPGWSFVEADFSQIELRIAAFIARERAMMQLYATGQDIHMAMAMLMTGRPASLVTKEERKKAKAVNFGYLYGMGWRKFIQTAWANYGVRVTEEESIAFRKRFFAQFPGLLPWHAKQRRLVNQHARVESPLGRIRHLPDIRSPSKDVRAEAERQAINSPVQSMASDMALMAFVILARKFRSLGMDARTIGLVHDAVNFEIPNGELTVALPMIKDTMENLPLKRQFGVSMDIPIIADLKVGTHWGGAREIPVEEVYAWAQ